MSPINEMTPADAHAFLNDSEVQLIDVREADEFAAVSASGAVNVPLSELEMRFSEVDPNRAAVIICRSGARSQRAIEQLVAKGYDAAKLHNLQGGTLAWVEAGLPHLEYGQPAGGPAEEANTPEAQPGTPPTREQVLEALKIVKDPEIPVNVVDLGLVYEVEIGETGHVDVSMTLTSVGCPVQDLIRADAEMAVSRLAGVSGVTVEFVWNPPWNMSRMSEDGKRQMRMFGFNV